MTEAAPRYFSSVPAWQACSNECLPQNSDRAAIKCRNNILSLVRSFANIIPTSELRISSSGHDVSLPD